MRLTPARFVSHHGVSETGTGRGNPKVMNAEKVAKAAKKAPAKSATKKAATKKSVAKKAPAKKAAKATKKAPAKKAAKASKKKGVLASLLPSLPLPSL